MKNVHILPTDKPSQLYNYNDTPNILFLDLLREREPVSVVQHHNIYITSDEEIRKGDFFLHPFNTIHKAGGNLIDKDFKKIILTTDQDLIKDGVQTIDDEFLEWFVSKANDSGKPIDVVELRLKGNLIEGYHTVPLGQIAPIYLKHQIIIPKEVLNSISSKNIPSEFNDIVNKEFFNLIEEPKQETFEEAAINCWAEGAWDNRDDFTDGFIEGAKWQQEQDKNKYREEEVEIILQQLKLKLKSGVLKWQEDFEFDLKEWFEQFKKK
jgi:hypothetical protein